MSNEDVKFQVGAEDAGVDATMAKVSKSVETAVNDMKEKLESLTGVFSKIQSAFMAFTAVLAGGEAFKEAIESTVDVSKESVALGRQLGISATDASVLKAALNSVFVTQEQYSAGAAKITQTLNKNEAAFTALGVATRDQNGNFLDTAAIMQATNERLLEFKEGTDRNVEGVKIYGRSWAEIAPILKVTAAVMEEAHAKASALGLIVGEESVAQSLQYRQAMNGVHEVLEGIEVTIGNALIPVLTSMGEWFASIGPTVINIFKAAIESVYVVLSTLKLGVVEWVDTIVGSFNIVVAQVERLMMVLKAVKDGANWEGVKTAWASGTKGIETATKDMVDSLKAEQDEAAKNFDAFQDHMAGNQTATKKPVGGETSDGGALKTQMAELAQGLEAAKNAYAQETLAKGQFIEFSKQQEIDYWKSILATKHLSAEDGAKIQETIDKLSYGLAKQGYDNELAAMKEQEAKYKNNLQAKLAIAQEMAAKIAAAEGADSAKAKEAGAQVLAIEREIDAQRLERVKATQDAIAKVALSSIDAEENAAKLQVANGEETSLQLLAQERQFEAARLAVAIDGINAQIAAANANPEENVKLLEQLNAQKLAAATKYQNQIAALSTKATVDQEKHWDTLFKSMESGFTKVFQNFLNGTATLGATIRGLAASVAQSFEQMVAKNISSLLAQAAAGKTIKLKELMGAAGTAAGHAYSAIAGIPYVGPFLAPAAAAVAYAGVMAFGSDVSAEGGYDIPAGVNPLVQTHQREMILPEKYADVVRGLAANGGGGGGGATLNVQAMDAQSFVKFLNNNAGPLGAALRKMNSRFMTP